MEHTDAERRRLERDLHDSAQQHVLALGTAVDAALQDVVDDGDRAALMRCLAGIRQVLDELRELSHGFYPAVLAQTGLRDALDGVIDRARQPVTLLEVPSGRLPADVERAIYLFVARHPHQPASCGRRRTTSARAGGGPDPGHRPAGRSPLRRFSVLGGSIEVDATRAPPTIARVLPIDESWDAG